MREREKKRKREGKRLREQVGGGTERKADSLQSREPDVVPDPSKAVIQNRRRDKLFLGQTETKRICDH